jgi:hypothetical protein
MILWCSVWRMYPVWLWGWEPLFNFSCIDLRTNSASFTQVNPLKWFYCFWDTDRMYFEVRRNGICLHFVSVYWICVVWVVGLHIDCVYLSALCVSLFDVCGLGGWVAYWLRLSVCTLCQFIWCVWFGWLGCILTAFICLHFVLVYLMCVVWVDRLHIECVSTA